MPLGSCCLKDEGKGTQQIKTSSFGQDDLITTLSHPHPQCEGELVSYMLFLREKWLLQPRWVFPGAQLPSSGKQVWPLAWNTVASWEVRCFIAFERPYRRFRGTGCQLEKDIPLEKMFTLWHHRLSGHEFEQTPGDSEGQGSLVCCSPWGRKESNIVLATELHPCEKQKVPTISWC